MSENKDIKTALPKLRFPEFIDMGTWQIKQLKDVGNIIGGGTPDTKNEYFWQNGDIIWLTPSEIGASKYISNSLRKITELGLKNSSAKLLPKGAIVLTTRATLGEMGILTTPAATNQGFHSIVVKDCYNTEYVYCLQPLIKALCYKFAKGSTFLEVSSLSVKSFNLPIPNSKEQIKIAECLSSLDDVISGVSDKIEALKEYKKGLMQQLFPAEGKTTPAFRFPEFQDSGEWESHGIKSVCSSYSGGTPSTTEPKYYGGTIPFIRSAEINKETTELFLTEEGLHNSSAKLVEKGSVLVALYGANSGDVAISKIDGAINQAILCLKSKWNNAFICYYLTLKKNWIINTYIQGGQGNLSGEIIKSVSLLFPNIEEQQRIATTLLALDNIIEIQTNQLEQLKAHKKGLMQQLFPNLNE